MILDGLVTGRREFGAGGVFYEMNIADGLLADRIFADTPTVTRWSTVRR